MKLLFAIAMSLPPGHPHVDTLIYDIKPVTVTASLKLSGDYRELPAAATTLMMDAPGNEFIVEPKDLSLAVPNMLHADYGSRMTGSVYIRGLGSRIDQPATGLYVDNVPVLNKNNYDFDYFDLARIDILRGPQGTLYGRNTIGGVVDVQTLSPFDYQGVRIGAGYGNGNTWHTQAAVYLRPKEKFGISVSGSHRSTDGFFTNKYDGSDADGGRSSALRIKIQAWLSSRWTMENSLSANLVRQDGFAYAPYNETTGRTGPIDHNDPCTYDRTGLVNGLTFRYGGEGFQLASTTGYQFTDDDMVLDQDFSPESMFTLRQSQVEHAATQEFVARSNSAKRWQWISGFFGFFRRLSTDAPVNFKTDGIDNLILENANKGIRMLFPDAVLEIEERESGFPIHSNFELPAGGLSLYHQSSWDVGRWKFIAGLRTDWEYTSIRYANSAGIHYRVIPTLSPEFTPLPVSMKGDSDKSYFEAMPRAAVMYKTAIGNLYASVSRGYKAGGYNTQIFSDILQNRMMNDMISDIFGTDPAHRNVEDLISYEPERSWNYEIGGHFSAAQGLLHVDAALFYIDCRNQQLAVFPSGQGTGRMMSNAGRTRSFGAELSAVWRVGDFRVNGSYGYTNAKFIAYQDGNEDYSGNFVPYAPQNTLSVTAEYTLDFHSIYGGHLRFGLGGQGVGRIWWNESNTIPQPFYGLLNASIAWETAHHFTFSVWTRNLTGTDYNTFYFKSVGRSFVQRGKPLQAGINLFMEF